MLLTAYGESTPPEDSISYTKRLHPDWQPETALTALRDAMGSTPYDPDGRGLPVNGYLHQWVLAGTALGRAVERGLAPVRALLPPVEAFFAEGRILDVIERSPDTPDYGMIRFTGEEICPVESHLVMGAIRSNAVRVWYRIECLCFFGQSTRVAEGLTFGPSRDFP